jgi:hypothetical protein
LNKSAERFAFPRGRLSSARTRLRGAELSADGHVVFKFAEKPMPKMPYSSAWRVAVASSMFVGAAAFAQTPPEPAAPASPAPSQETSKPAAQDESAAVRIRGLVEKVDEQGVVVQLSQGITLRVNIWPQAPVYSASRMELAQLQSGADVSIRTRAAQAAGENQLAAEVLSIASMKAAPFPGAYVNGVIKLIDRSEKRPVLVVAEGKSVRRLTVTDETTFWRLQIGALADVKPAMSISVLISQDKAGGGSAQRVVFGSPPPGSMLPL